QRQAASRGPVSCTNPIRASPVILAIPNTLAVLLHAAATGDARQHSMEPAEGEPWAKAFILVNTVKQATHHAPPA
ncbi:MAG TPA: hypothetical protein VN229_03135, partial [Terriglobales bacterium]|nr:hypothetical protein [Terriglobales bacterium]